MIRQARVKTLKMLAVLPEGVAAGSHPTGPAYPVTKRWQAEVERRLDEKDMSKADLAREVGCKPPSITSLLKPGAKQSRLVPRINKVLQIGMSDRHAKLAAALESLSDEQVDAVVTFIELMARTTK